MRSLPADRRRGGIQRPVQHRAGGANRFSYWLPLWIALAAGARRDGARIAHGVNGIDACWCRIPPLRLTNRPVCAPVTARLGSISPEADLDADVTLDRQGQSARRERAQCRCSTAPAPSTARPAAPAPRRGWRNSRQRPARRRGRLRATSSVIGSLFTGRIEGRSQSGRPRRHHPLHRGLGRAVTGSTRSSSMTATRSPTASRWQMGS